MYNFVIFLHVIGAVALGYYLISPLLLIRAYKLTGTVLENVLSGLYATGRVMQFLLIVQLLTGGYLIAKLPYTKLWIVLTIVIFLIVGAVTGILNGKMKKAIQELKRGGTGTSYLQSIKLLSYLSSLSMLAILYIMMYPALA